MKIRLAGMISSSISNGEGIRKVIFAQGCKHNCKDCFNPETHSFNGGEIVDCDYIINEITEDYMIDGVTFSGGDPFEQPKEFTYISKNIDCSIWAYTGYTFEEIMNNISNGKKPEWKELMECLDVLVDGKFDCEKTADYKFKGSSNQRIIDVKKSLEENRIVIYME